MFSSKKTSKSGKTSKSNKKSNYIIIKLKLAPLSPTHADIRET
jgi:hypothetical protein